MTGSSLTTRHAKTAVAVCIIAIGITIFWAMWHSVMTHGDFSRLDQPILSLLVSHRSPELTTFMEFITNLLAPVTFALIVTASCIIWSVRHRETWRPLLLMGSMLAAVLTSTTIKSLVGRTRPPHDFMLAPFELDFSFPSGHTIGIAVFVFVLSYLLYSRKISMRRAAIWTLSGGLLIVLVALSRLYLGYHWITDVTASIGLALIILGGVIIIDIYTPARLKRRTLERPAKPPAP